MQDMRDTITEKCELASFYADDGAYHSAARVLTELAKTVTKHAHFVQPTDMTLERNARALSKSQRKALLDAVERPALRYWVILSDVPTITCKALYSMRAISYEGVLTERGLLMRNHLLKMQTAGTFTVDGLTVAA